MNRISVIILNYNQWKLTALCLESLLKSTYPIDHLIVVDNHSTDDSLSNLMAWASCKTSVDATLLHSDIKTWFDPHHQTPLDYTFFNYNHPEKTFKKHATVPNEDSNATCRLTFIQSDHNLGYASGNNIGIDFLNNNCIPYDYLWILNNDTLIKPDTLQTLVKHHQADKIGVFGATLYHYDQPNIIQSLGWQLNSFLSTVKNVSSPKQIHKVDYLAGASLLITKAGLNKVPRLPSDYFMYYEDADYCLSIQKNNLKIKIVPDAIVYHKEGGTTVQNRVKIKSQTEFLDLTTLKSRIFFSKKFKLSRIGLRFGLFFSCLNRIKRKQFKRSWKVFKLALFLS